MPGQCTCDAAVIEFGPRNLSAYLPDLPGCEMLRAFISRACAKLANVFPNRRARQSKLNFKLELRGPRQARPWFDRLTMTLL